MNILFLAPHLSTGGMPQFLLKRIESLGSSVNIFVVEYQNYSDDYVVQKNKIKAIVPNYYTLGDNKLELLDIINRNKIDVVHIDEMSEQLDEQMVKALYSEKRTWKIFETCHNISFNCDKEKKFHPEAYLFCTPYHLETFAKMPSDKFCIKYPIERVDTKIIVPYGFDIRKTNVINVGLWTPGKNQKEGIEIAKKYPNMEFHFIGNQAINFKEYWEPLMKELPSNVKVWGERNDIQSFMALADIFMFNSTWECNPLVLCEAISNNLPIIAHNLPQYCGMYDEYINPIDTDLNTIERTYQFSSDNNFGNDHLLAYNKEYKLQEQDYQITQHFVNNPFFEINGPNDAEFKVEFYDDEMVCQYSNIIKSNSWIKLNRQYYTKWTTRVFYKQKCLYDNTLNFTGKKIYIAIDSSSLGDTIAWVPYALEFQKKHNCKVVLSSFWNKILDIPEIELIEPGIIVPNIYAQYTIGWFYDSNKEPVLPNTIKLQETATRILGLDFQEIKPNMKYDVGNNKYGKYVTIATNSTSGCKLWIREGWQGVINHLHKKGYKIINVSKEDNFFNNCEKIDDTSIENTMSVIHHSEFFIGLSSGLSWLAWAMNKKVVMISNFTEANHEFDCIRVDNRNVCNGCWNEPNIVFDKGDWDWCKHKNTPRQFECHKSISINDVINEINLSSLIPQEIEP